MSQFNITNVLSTDGLDKCGIDVLRSAGINVVEQKYSNEELKVELPKYDAVIIRSATNLDSAILTSLEAPNRLQVIARAGTGTDNIDLDAATSGGYLVLNTPAANTLSAAEHTCALICSLSRRIPQACASMKASKWERKAFMGTELNGKILAIIGLGRIGKEVASRMQSFNMKVIGYDPIIGADDVRPLNIDWLTLDEIWPIADYVTIHVPLLKQTENLINESVFQRCKPSVKFVNCSRGGIINETDLLTALNNGTCSGAALDVFVQEPPTNTNTTKLIAHPNMICTPHLGASTKEAQKRVALEIAHNLLALINGESLIGNVNGHILSCLYQKESKLWLNLLKVVARISKYAKSSMKLIYNSSSSFAKSRNFENFLKSLINLNSFDKTEKCNLINLHLQTTKINVDVKKADNSTENWLVKLDLSNFSIKLSGDSQGRICLSGMNTTNFDEAIYVNDKHVTGILTDNAIVGDTLKQLIDINKLKGYISQDGINVLFIEKDTSKEIMSKFVICF